MTNYRKSMVESLAEVRGLQEDNMDMLRKAAGGAMQTIKMKDGKLQMDSFTASAIMQVYDKVNPANQKKMAVMINKGTKAGMLKLQSFAMKQVKSEYEPQLDEWTVSDVEIAMKKKYGKIDKEAIEKLKKVQHRGNVDRNDLVKAGHGKLDVAGLAYSKEEVGLDEAVKHMEVPPDAARGRGVPDDHRGRIGYDSKENQQAYNSITHGSPDNQIDVAKHFMKKGLKSKALHKAVADELGVIHWEVHKQLTHDKSKLHPLHMSFEGEELDEAKYELYHKDFSTAMQHAYKMAKKLYGITVDPKEIDDKVASGPRKPSSGKTNSYRLKGDKGAIQVQVYNMDRLRSHKQLPADKNYELNMYKEEVELDEAVKEYDVKIKVGSKTNSYNIMSKDELSAAQSVLHSIMARSKTGGSPGLDAVRKQYPDMKSLNKKGVSVSIKEELDLDEALPSHLKKFFDKDGNPKSKEGKAAWERLAKMKGFKKYTAKQVKMAIGIAFDKRYVQGNMTGAVNAIEKIAKGLSEIEPVRNALRRANEEVEIDENKLPDMREALRQVRTEKPIQLDEVNFNIGDKVKVVPKAKGSKSFSGKITGKLKNGKHEVQVYNKNVSHMNIMAHELVKEEVELDEGREKDARQLVNPNKEVMVVKKNRVVVINKKDQDKYLKQGWELAEEVELDEGIKVGDNVHLGFGAKGGTGFKGKVIKIDSNNVHIKNSKGKEYKGPMKFSLRKKLTLMKVNLNVIWSRRKASLCKYAL